MVAEADSAYMLVLEVSAAAGRFTISFSHRFATDVYLDAFLDELRAQGLTPEVADRHPLRLAPIADYRTTNLANDERVMEQEQTKILMSDEDYRHNRQGQHELTIRRILQT